MKLLSPLVHGILDYAVVLAFLLAPKVFSFADTPATICYVIAALHAVLSLCTAYPLGALKRIPFPAHGSVEVVASIALVLMPWLARFDGHTDARNFFLASGIVLFVVWLTTQYRTNQRFIADSDWRVHQQSGRQGSPTVG